MIRNLRKLFTVITVSVLAQTSLFGQTESSIKNVFWQPNDLQPGSVTFVTVELNRKATKVSGQFLGKDLLFFYSGRAGVDAHEFLRKRSRSGVRFPKFSANARIGRCSGNPMLTESRADGCFSCCLPPLSCCIFCYLNATT